MKKVAVALVVGFAASLLLFFSLGLNYLFRSKYTSNRLAFLGLLLLVFFSFFFLSIFCFLYNHQFILSWVKCGVVFLSANYGNRVCGSCAAQNNRASLRAGQSF